MKPAIAIPATLALVYRAWSRKSLTPAGIIVAAATAIAHAAHPWPVYFALLSVFFLAGTAVTKVKHDVKAHLTHSSSGSPGGEGPRNHVQVLANSAVASVLVLLHTYTLSKRDPEPCWGHRSDVLVVGIVANYAAVAADTFSSELGILARSEPRLITAPWKKVPKGTNGGVTLWGIMAGALGAAVVAGTSVALIPFCEGWTTSSKTSFAAAVITIGMTGSLLDSLLGALLQASVVDVRTGKVIEGNGGGKVPVHSSIHVKERAVVRSKAESYVEGKEGIAATSALDKGGVKVRKGEVRGAGDFHESRRIEVGHDVLSNNGVNLLMATLMSIGAMVGAAMMWGISLGESIVSS
ncbi:integral membrane protein DUF92-domain-containing protein [Lineolata rhizophorae]|uniref:Integral membrane protein DUF92-domain-containing protein n=1 Tax=Lineolata rhizophorae TaxID=578093 RepID=A0A6A6PBA5_9PEZI|nr:integral membrane protein DUF92-domain-containing protein [Lineolata rhizophorae]